jgi:Protein of unknown function (DUF4238)
MGKGQRNHYIPEFYLKQWCNPPAEGPLIEYCRRYKGVEARKSYPAGTGYEHDLYTFHDLPPAAATFLEEQFLKQADDAAHAALQELLCDNLNLNAGQRSAWSRFIMSLMHRNPEGVARLRAKIESTYPEHLEKARETYEALRAPYDPLTFEEFRLTIGEAIYQELTLRVLQRAMDSEAVGNHLNNLQWGVITINRSYYPLLTSDRPLIMTNGMIHPRSHIMMPISPNRIFVASDTIQTMREIHDTFRNEKRPVQAMNDRMARQARKFVWGTDKSQLRFVANRLGEKARWSSFE